MYLFIFLDLSLYGLIIVSNRNFRPTVQIMEEGYIDVKC